APLRQDGDTRQRDQKREGTVLDEHAATLVVGEQPAQAGEQPGHQGMTLPNMFRTLVPSVVKMLMPATLINPTIKVYSIAVAARSSALRRRNKPRMIASPMRLSQTSRRGWQHNEILVKFVAVTLVKANGRLVAGPPIALFASRRLLHRARGVAQH